MKLRSGFVSNSSSSSFVIRLDDLTIKQLNFIHSHKIKGNKILGEGNNPVNDMDVWSIEENEVCVRGHTWLDNFSMRSYLRLIGVSSDVIEWGE